MDHVESEDLVQEEEGLGTAGFLTEAEGYRQLVHKPLNTGTRFSAFRIAGDSLANGPVAQLGRRFGDGSP